MALALLVLAGCGREGACPSARPATPLDHATTGTITGEIHFEGTPPAMKPLAFGSDAVCAAQHPAPVPAGDALIRDGRVENVFVYLKEGLGDRAFAVPSAPVVIDQRGCLYQPRVVGAQVCQPVKFVNSDATAHNVHGTPHASSPWNFAMGVKGSERTIRLEKPEVMVSVRCDLHPWMQAWVGALDHPYFAVTGADGRFRLTDVPPGDYVVAAWHEALGTRETRVSLAAQGRPQVTLTYAAK
jgi:plastocyanin